MTNPTAQSANLPVIERLHAAMNARDLDAFVACFAADYDSQHPAHPDRTFIGTAQVRKNWTGMFGNVPDFHADLIRSATAGETAWTEWHWQGTNLRGEKFEMAGVIIFGITNDLFSWAHFFMEPVEQGGAGTDASVRGFVGGTQR